MPMNLNITFNNYSTTLVCNLKEHIQVPHLTIINDILFFYVLDMNTKDGTLQNALAISMVQAVQELL